jgi:hypothetical protein
MSNWTEWLTSGDKYLKTVNNSKGKFSTTVLYNLLGLAFENYVMAALDFRSKLPENHSITDLVNALETITTLDQNLKNELLKLEEIQSICPIIDYQRREPTDDEVTIFKNSINIVARMSHQLCGNGKE